MPFQLIILEGFLNCHLLLLASMFMGQKKSLLPPVIKKMHPFGVHSLFFPIDLQGFSLQPQKVLTFAQKLEKKKKRIIFIVSFSPSFVCSLKSLGCLYFETWKVEWMFGIQTSQFPYREIPQTFLATFLTQPQRCPMVLFNLQFLDNTVYIACLFIWGKVDDDYGS